MLYWKATVLAHTAFAKRHPFFLGVLSFPFWSPSASHFRLAFGQKPLPSLCGVQGRESNLNLTNRTVARHTMTAVAFLYLKHNQMRLNVLRAGVSSSSSSREWKNYLISLYLRIFLFARLKRNHLFALCFGLGYILAFRFV